MWGRCIGLYKESLQVYDDRRVRLALACVLLALYGEDALGQVLELVEKPLAAASVEETACQLLGGLFRACFYGGYRRKLKADQEEKHPALQAIVGESEHMLVVCSAIIQYASVPGHMPVLIIGPSATGKELVAHALHDCSARSGQPFIAVNCAAIPESMFEACCSATSKGLSRGP
jgi:DNA-binding NtrC family response regulator